MNLLGWAPILCLTSRTTVTSARIQDEDACYGARNLRVFSRVQKGTPGFTHKGCVIQRVSLGAASDVTVILEMRQSIRDLFSRSSSLEVIDLHRGPHSKCFNNAEEHIINNVPWIMRNIKINCCKSIPYLFSEI